MGRTGKVIVREQQRGAVNMGYLKPGEATKRFAAQVPFVFNSYHFLQSWKRLGVRPPTGSEESPVLDRWDALQCPPGPVPLALNSSWARRRRPRVGG